MALRPAPGGQGSRDLDTGLLYPHTTCLWAVTVTVTVHHCGPSQSRREHDQGQGPQGEDGEWEQRPRGEDEGSRDPGVRTRGPTFLT